MEPIGLDTAQILGSLDEWRSAHLDGARSPRIAAADQMPSADVSPAGGAVVPAFEQVLNGFLSRVDAAQHRSNAMVESLALGEPVDVHQVMLALSEASNALQLTLQVRGKLLEAYQELMRLQI